jgi:hypothetical protein
MTRANPKKGRLSPPEIVLFLTVGTVGLILLIGGLVSDAEAHNDNVKKGEVKVSTGLFKICDGKNLVYTIYGDGVAVSPNDPQCQ